MAEDFRADRNVTEGKGNEARGSLKWISKCIRYFFLFTAVSAELLWETCLRGWENLLTISVCEEIKLDFFTEQSRLATTFLLRSSLYHEMIWFINRAFDFLPREDFDCLTPEETATHSLLAGSHGLLCEGEDCPFSKVKTRDSWAFKMEMYHIPSSTVSQRNG